jgi:hypothetical protein
VLSSRPHFSKRRQAAERHWSKLCVSCTSTTVMRHRDIQNQRSRRKTVVFSVWQNNLILALYISAFIVYWGDFVDFN